jgi:SOS response regulatory protein OraA/RecX
VTSPLEARRQAAAERRARRAAVEHPDVVMAAAAAYLAARPRTVKETRSRLEALGYRPELCEEVVVRLVELGYLDDLAYAQAWVEGRDRARPRGEVALRRELSRRGVADVLIEQVLVARRGPPARAASHPSPRAKALSSGTGNTSARASSMDDEPSGGDALAARRLIERRLPALLREPDHRRRRQKAYALLARNGFDPDVCREQSLRLMLHEGEDEPPEG